MGTLLALFWVNEILALNSTKERPTLQTKAGQAAIQVSGQSLANKLAIERGTSSAKLPFKVKTSPDLRENFATVSATLWVSLSGFYVYF